ncbi:enoyl-CoA hydratase/isomerase family protein [Cupriavidus pinatubonensis]|uniref:enoyl-CoA hydratase/isomerase family protein n=1 Tax=Cupriavidus pinatubonensis TaxID=248026 RepID=UPI0011268C08|nr:enoyl-CoA hydratase/isomerase family protein [Cupriavidus pinatubonensis]TPQ38240.1 enoyl-CoA hydratase/isomerase family protein [Cupriavidus pinatubonensis]
MEAREDNLIIELREEQLVITIDRAQKANALTVAMMQAITGTIKESAQDATVKSIVLTASGEKIFCAGVDVRELPPDGDVAKQKERRSLALAALQDAVLDTEIPVICALNGLASGAGGMIALLADACVAAENAAISLPEIDLGIATFSGASMLEAIGGRALAKDMIQSGRRMPASEAQGRGLINVVAPPGESLEQAITVARRLGERDRTVFANNKRWLNRKIKVAIDEARAEHALHRQASAR